jgi:hypothetical protein
LGQSYASLFDTLSVDWSKYETLLPIDVRARTLSDSIFALDNPYGSTSAADFHFIDLNSDGLLDVLFNGHRGEGEDLIIWLRVGSGYEKMSELEGRVTSLLRSEPWTPLSFRLYDYGCCASRFDFFNQYVPAIDSGKFAYKLTTQVMVSSTDQPSVRFYMDSRPITVKSKMEVRFDPLINNEPWDADYGKAVGNLYATFSTGSTGRVLGEGTDSLGHTWYFVMMNLNAPCTYGFDIETVGRNSGGCAQIAGWVLASDLKQ